MSSPSLLTILHISDFHYSTRKLREQGIIVDALIRDLETLCVGHRRPDLVLFSGDLVKAAGVDCHSDAYDFLLDRVLKATGCSEDRLFIAPGNHDLSWSGLEEHGDDLRSWRAAIGQKDEMARINYLYEKGAFDAAVAAKFADYLELDQYLRLGGQGSERKLKTAFVTVDRIEAIDLDLVTFNTAVFSSGGNKAFNADERNLVVPEYAVMEAVKALTPGSFRLFAMHHPFSHLSEVSARYLEGEITRHADLHLFGHMHDPQPRKVVGLKGEVVSNQAGALFTSRTDYYDGYALITVDRQERITETLVRSYFKERDEFDDGVDLVEGGRWWSSKEAKKHFQTIASPVAKGALREHLAGPALATLLSRESASGGDGDLHDRFVPPPLVRHIIAETTPEDENVAVETPVLFDEVIRSDTNFILYARPEYGRTTLLKQIRYGLLKQAHDIDFPRLPALIEFRDISSNVDNMLRKVKGGSEETPENTNVEALMKLGHVCILIDDVLFGDTNRMRILRQFVQRYPKARYVLSSPHASTTNMGAFVKLGMPVGFDFVEVHEFRRDNMRQLLRRDDRCTDVEHWLDRLQAEFLEINLPFTAANGSILIEILSEKHNFTPTNRAVLMEQFVDSTLRKASVDQGRRETFDYTNKTDLLSHIAAWMAKRDEYVPQREDLRAEMRRYVEAMGLNLSLEDQFAEFQAARIFVSKSEDRMAFRYRGVMEYFIALRMTTDQNFRAWVIDEKRYLRFINEIQYYAGKLRNDASLVNLVAEWHARIIAAVTALNGEIDLNQFDHVLLPTESKEADLDQTSHEVLSPPLSQEEKDEEIEGDIPKDAEDRQEVFRPKADDVGDRLTLSLLLYSGLIKNMELISDTDKRRHLSEIWRGWAYALGSSLRFAPRLARERRFRANGIVYEVQAPHGMSDATLLRQLMLQMPHLTVRMISGSLGTEKLERQITEPQLDEHCEPSVVEFLRVGLIADLRLAATPGSVATLVTRLQNSKYMLWSLIVHIGQLRRLDHVRPEHFKALEAPVAEAIAALKGGSRKVRREEKDRQLNRQRRDRLLLTMKRRLER